MRCDYNYCDIKDDDWDAVAADIDPRGISGCLKGLLDAFRVAGAVHFIEETAYIDRDYSAAYAAFYSGLYRMRPKLCRRLHFFATSLSEACELEDPSACAEAISEQASHYLGFIVVRPLAHAPVSRGIVSSRHFEGPGVEVAVRSPYVVHLMGAELTVVGTPVTEQDRLTGACAQATLWTAARHMHNRHATPWYSVADITEAATKPMDSALSRSLPAGSDSLSDDNMLRALRTMGEHPVIYLPEESRSSTSDQSGDDEIDEAEDAAAGVNAQAAPERVWEVAPEVTIARYLDSGIPVIIGLHQDKGDGHAVVAVGAVWSTEAPFDPDQPMLANKITHFLVNDDQEGVYRRLAVRPDQDDPGSDDGDGDREGDPGDDRSLTEEVENDGLASKSDDLASKSLADAFFLIVPLPPKVFMKAEIAEVVARDKLRRLREKRSELLLEASKRSDSRDWDVDPDFHAIPEDALITRTYLTQGWKYKHRLLRNRVPEALKAEVRNFHLPRLVWVTEFSTAEDTNSLDACVPRVRAHVAVDATGNKFDDGSALIAHMPGIVCIERLDAEVPSRTPTTHFYVLGDDEPYYPKVRGWRDYNACDQDAA